MATLAETFEQVVVEADARLADAARVKYREAFNEQRTTAKRLLTDMARAIDKVSFKEHAGWESAGTMDWVVATIDRCYAELRSELD